MNRLPRPGQSWQNIMASAWHRMKMDGGWLISANLIEIDWSRHFSCVKNYFPRIIYANYLISIFPVFIVGTFEIYGRCHFEKSSEFNFHPVQKSPLRHFLMWTHHSLFHCPRAQATHMHQWHGQSMVSTPQGRKRS